MQVWPGTLGILCTAHCRENHLCRNTLKENFRGSFSPCVYVCLTDGDDSFETGPLLRETAAAKSSCEISEYQKKTFP